MLDFLTLLFVAIIIFPIALIFFKQYTVKHKLYFLVFGLIIAFLGILALSFFSLYYSILVMLGLVFVGSVLMTKRLEAEQNKIEEEVYVKTENKPAHVVKTINRTEMAKSLESVPEIQDDWLKPQPKEMDK